MLLRIARSKQTFTIVLLPFVAILLWLNIFYHKGVLFPVSTTPVALWFNTALGLGFWPTFLFLFVLVSAGFYLNYLNTKYIFFPERTYFPGLIFLLLTSVINNANLPLAISILFILLAIDRLIATYKIEHLVYNSFDASIAIAMASIFYFPAVFIMLFVWASIINLRSFYWREWVYSIIGFAVPYIFILVYYFLTDKDFTTYYNYLLGNFEHSKAVFKFGKAFIVFLSVVGFITLASSQRLLRVFPTMKILSRKSFILFLIFFLITFLIMLFIKNGNFDFWYLTSIPLCYLFTVFFITVKRYWWGELLFWMLVSSIVFDLYFL